MTALFPSSIWIAALKYDALFWVLSPLVAIEMIFAHALRFSTYFLIDWNRRVDPVWVVEMISGGTALLYAVWMIADAKNPASQLIEMNVPGILWFAAMVALALYQLYCAVAGSRVNRSAGCVAAAVLWSALLAIVAFRAGLASLEPALIMIDFACVCACLAYYVSPQQPHER